MCGLLPTSRERRSGRNQHLRKITINFQLATLAKKRNEYWKLVDRYFKLSTEDSHKDTYHQIKIDIPRTNPSIGLYQQAQIQVFILTFSLTILFSWSKLLFLGTYGTRTIYMGYSSPRIRLCSRPKRFNLSLYDGFLF